MQAGRGGGSEKTSLLKNLQINKKAGGPESLIGETQKFSAKVFGARGEIFSRTKLDFS